MLTFATIAAATTLFIGGPAAAAPDHAAEVDTFARIMADVRTAAEVCKGVSPDWTVVNAAKDGLHIVEVDYFAFRKLAHDLADNLEERFRVDGTSDRWCSEAIGLYGPQGASLKDALRQ